MSHTTKYLIIGNSIAGISAAEAIRAVDKDGKCTIVTKELKRPYSKPMLTHLVAQELSEGGLNFRPDSIYDDLNIEILANTMVTGIDSETKSAITDKGEKIFFDKALIATGSRPRTLDIEGIDAAGVCFFHTYEDAQKIINIFGNTNKAIVIGAGLIGVRAAYALKAKGLQTTLIEMTDRIMPAIMDKTGSDILSDALVKNGTEVFLSTTVKKVITTNNKVIGVEIFDGETLPCDLLIVTAGVLPDFSAIDGSQIKTQKGVCVDQFLQTNKADIYAAGDIIEFNDRVTGSLMVNANWPNASIQGALAGNNMAGKQMPYDGSVGMNSIECGTVPCITMGLVNPDENQYTVFGHSSMENHLYKKLVFDNGKLVGAILVGQIGQAGLLLKLINEKIDVLGIEGDILKEGKKWFALVRNLNKKEMEGDIDWPDSVSSDEHYEKKFNEEKWTEREEGRRKW